MKKVLLFVVCLLLCSRFLYADGMGDEKSKIWRSTEICGALVEARLSTVAAYAYMLQVTSGSVSSSLFQYINATGTVASGAALSSSTAYDVDTTGDRWEIRRGLSGIRYTKTGGSCISFLWDFISAAPRGEESLGLGR